MFKSLFKRGKTSFKKRDAKDIKFDTLMNNSSECKSRNYIDNTTWSDLDMDDMFTMANYTHTTCGESCLYNWLRNPLMSTSEIKDRRDKIDTYKGISLDAKIRGYLSDIAYVKNDYCNSINNYKKSNTLLLVLLSLISIINVLIILQLIMLKTTELIFLLVIIFPLNIFIHNYFNTRYGNEGKALSYTLRLLQFAYRLKRTDYTDLSEETRRCSSMYDRLNKLHRRGYIINRIEGMDLLADYINILFLVKEINFLITQTFIFKNKELIIGLYNTIGLIDGYMSINIFRESIKEQKYCIPAFDRDRNSIDIKDIYHPLLDTPTSNSITINSSIVITGSNMSGKSTFLRTVGINCILAQSITTVFAHSYTSDIYFVASSIRHNDDIDNNTSYFMAEAESIRRMFNMHREASKKLILIDEAFRGTNPLERLAATKVILNKLNTDNHIIIVTTHDLDMIQYLQEYDKYFFTENVTKNKLDFEYKIKKGINYDKNAIKILEYLKYPEDIIRGINNFIG